MDGMPGQVTFEEENELEKQPEVEADAAAERTGSPKEKPKLKVQATLKHSDPFAGIEDRLDKISAKLDEALSTRFTPLRPKDESPPAPPIICPKPFASEPVMNARTTRMTKVVFDPLPKKSKFNVKFRGKNVSAMDASLSEEDNDGDDTNFSDAGSTSSRERRLAHRVRAVDLKLAWQIHAKECQQEIHDSEDATRPVLRLLYRSRRDQIWELLDDQNSSTAAWCISQFLKTLVIVNFVVTNLQTTEEQTIDPLTAAVMETIFDSIFLCEFCIRLFSAPSKRRYMEDSLNWADVLSACGLPVRLATWATFGVQQAFVSSDWNWGRPMKTRDARGRQIILLFFLPLVRLLKLLRYFDSFRLLIDACKNSFEALPVLTYVMALITTISATGIYLVESRSNIPSLQHSIWLSLVTMTTVGYGDYYPKSLAGFLIVSILTIASVLFLALPVGIIGNEFTACWSQRTRVLLLTRAQKCLAKWGYSANDVKVLFEFVDTDGNGNLNLNEFVELFHQMRIGITMDSAVDLFQLFDDDQSGTIEYDEFLRHIFPEEYVKGAHKNKSIQVSRTRVSEALHHLDHLRESLA
ncbi:unnamed protein product [Durusdinium trenchii]|uniref:EF-hand domain-containing protein n=1 Tax=Durusdinium trenchii TaxID=1381693 RepID=A0ABP0P9X6_9DINO